MNVSIAGLIVQADAAISCPGHAPSTDMQYRWAWSQFEKFCSREGVDEFTEDIVALYLQAVAAGHREGRIKEWKRKLLLRKSTLVLVEVARTGSYRWALSRPTHPNDALDPVFRPFQEQSVLLDHLEGHVWLLALESSDADTWFETASTAVAAATQKAAGGGADANSDRTYSVSELRVEEPRYQVQLQEQYQRPRH